MQVEDRFRKTNHSSPEAQSKQTGRVLEPPVPSRSESFSNGNSESVHPALQRPAEPQVATASFAVVEETHATARWATGLLSYHSLVCHHIEKEERWAGVTLD